MTTAQIKYIVKTFLNDSTDTYTELEKCDYFITSYTERKYCGRGNCLYYLDTTTGVLKCFPCRIVTKKLPNRQYAEKGKVIYEFMLDKNRNKICDSYCFSEIAAIKLRMV